jgi:cell division topological specificity factor
MSLFRLLMGRRSAPLARERLQILLTHERANTGSSGLISALREDILRVIAQHVDVSPEKVEVTVKNGDGVAVLEIDIEIPQAAARAVMGQRRGWAAA